MTNELGPGWRDRYREFNMTPMNSASIGQVHHARLHDGRHVAVKVQYPGVANSIKSDLKNIALILTAGSLLPRGLFLDNSIAVLGRELADECDYLREAELGRRFGELLAGDPDFTVPAVIDDLCTPRVLTAEYVFGTPLSRSDDLSQELRDEVRSRRSVDSPPSPTSPPADWAQDSPSLLA
jgi:aarF domain-containing kinase